MCTEGEEERGAQCIIDCSLAVYAYNSITREWFEVALMISFIQKEGFKPTLKHAEGVCLPSLNWKMVPLERSLITDNFFLSYFERF